MFKSEFIKYNVKNKFYGCVLYSNNTYNNNVFMHIYLYKSDTIKILLCPTQIHDCPIMFSLMRVLIKSLFNYSLKYLNLCLTHPPINYNNMYITQSNKCF